MHVLYVIEDYESWWLLCDHSSDHWQLKRGALRLTLIPGDFQLFAFASYVAGLEARYESKWKQHTFYCFPRIYGADFKMEIYLKIAQLYLEEQDHVSAEAYINRAALLQSEVAKKELHIIYKVDRCLY